MKKQNSKISRYLRKISKYHLYIFAAGMPALLLLAGTVIINVFWSGIPFPPLAQKNDIIKDYMTLYIAMLGVAATLYGSFVVMYAYGGWKKQHNKAIEAERTMELINQIKSLNHALGSIYIPIGHYVDFSKKDINLYPNKREIAKKHYDDFISHFNKIIEEKDNCMMEFNYYIGYKRTPEVIDLHKTFMSLMTEIAQIHDEAKEGTFYKDCKSMDDELNKTLGLIDIFNNISLRISLDVLYYLYVSLNVEE